MSILTRRDPQERRRSSPPAIGRAPSLLDSFNYAFEGIIHVLRTQRNLRIHFANAIAVIAAAATLGVARMELIALLLAIAFVLVAEMINSAIEGAIDVSTTSFDPNAKLAKDIAAGAVLIASATAIAVGYLVFAHAAAHRTARRMESGIHEHGIPGLETVIRPRRHDGPPAAPLPAPCRADTPSGSGRGGLSVRPSPSLPPPGTH